MNSEKERVGSSKDRLYHQTQIGRNIDTPPDFVNCIPSLFARNRVIAQLGPAIWV
jgi:hypothetical protein